MSMSSSPTSSKSSPLGRRSEQRSSTKPVAPQKGRIDDILQGARARKVAPGAQIEDENAGARAAEANSGDPLSTTGSMQSNNTGGREVGGHTEESSADEETSIVRSGGRQTMDYQSTNQQRPKGVRDRPSTASIRQRGRIHEDHGGDNGDAESEGVVGGDEHESWWARILSEYGSIELENKGSVARDHLALERTFLAWLRTSLAFASIGIAITQLFRLNTSVTANNFGPDNVQHLRQMGKPLGATFLGISIVMLGVGFHRYFESQHWIIRGKFPASRGSVALVAAITFVLMITSLVVVVVVEPTKFEKR